jgi:hypothetical protein
MHQRCDYNPVEIVPETRWAADFGLPTTQNAELSAIQGRQLISPLKEGQGRSRSE